LGIEVNLQPRRISDSSEWALSIRNTISYLWNVGHGARNRCHRRWREATIQ
jgi:hypothetical protein